MFKALKEFFFGKPAAPQAEAPYKIETPATVARPPSATVVADATTTMLTIDAPVVTTSAQDSVVIIDPAQPVAPQLPRPTAKKPSAKPATKKSAAVAESKKKPATKKPAR